MWSGAIVLDVGCGNGAQLTRLREAGHRAIGVELDPEAAQASRRIGHAVVIARAESLPFRGSGCPSILCKVVIPYTDEDLPPKKWTNSDLRKGADLGSS